jgi:ABC-type transporter Mla subunit MlaD
MAETTGFKEALAALSELLPRVPEALAALSETQAALSEAAEHFLATVEARQVEAAELFPRLEVSLAGLAREAADGTAQAEQDRDLQDLLGDPGLAFEDQIAHLGLLLGQKQEHRLAEMVRALGASQANLAVLDSGRQALHEGLADGRRLVAGGGDAALAALQGLQSVIEAARGTISADVEQVGTEMDGQHTAQAREMEELRRDVEAYEASFVERIDHVREVVRQDADLMMENLGDRLDDLGSTLARALADLRAGLGDLDERLREAAEEAAEGRQSLAPYFEDLENLLPQLKQQISHVREAAAMVGIPF